MIDGVYQLAAERKDPDPAPARQAEESDLIGNLSALRGAGPTVGHNKASALKDVLFNFVQYSVMFLVIPLILTKDWGVIRRPSFLIPLILIIASITLRTYIRPVCAISVLLLGWLHFHHDLSDLGFRSRGWRWDAVMILLMGFANVIPCLPSANISSLTPVPALTAMLDRMFTNPASTEYIFYFGFLAERLSFKFGKWTPLLIGAMYVIHEMTNPEYWYEGVFFPMIFVGVTLFTALYLWRRNIVAAWLGDGLGRFLGNLF